MDFSKLHIAAATRLMIIILPLLGLAISTENAIFWLLAFFSAAVVGMSDQNLHPNDVPRLAFPVILIIGAAIGTAYLTDHPLLFILFMMGWSILQATSFAMSAFDIVVMTLGLVLYFVFVSSGMLEALSLLENYVAAGVGALWALVIVYGSSYLAANQRKQIPHVDHKPRADTIKQNLSLKSPLFIFGVVRGIALTVLMLLYLPDQNIHAFWMAVTILVVMLPEKAMLLSKAGTRTLGTLIGVIVVLVLSIFVDSQEAIAVLLLLTMFGYRSIMGSNYALDATFITVLVLGSSALSKPDWSVLVFARLFDTVIGAVLAVLLCYAFVFISDETGSKEATE